MDAITITVKINEDRHLVIDLPPDTPVGTARITIQPQDTQQSTEIVNPAREAARAKLQAAGALSTTYRVPEGAQLASVEERERVWKLFSQGRPSHELIDEDRGEY